MPTRRRDSLAPGGGHQGPGKCILEAKGTSTQWLITSDFKKSSAVEGGYSEEHKSNSFYKLSLSLFVHAFNSHARRREENK
jgi:hypothetical protein